MREVVIQAGDTYSPAFAHQREEQITVAAGVQELETGWMTIGQAAYLLDTSRQILYRRLKNKEIRAALVGRDVAGGRGAWIVSKPDLYRYARENGIHLREER